MNEMQDHLDDLLSDHHADEMATEARDDEYDRLDAANERDYQAEVSHLLDSCDCCDDGQCGCQCHPMKFARDRLCL